MIPSLPSADSYLHFLEETRTYPCPASFTLASWWFLNWNVLGIVSPFGSHYWHLLDFLGLHWISWYKDSGLLGCDAEFMGKWFRTFLRNVGNHLSTDWKSHPRRPEFLITLLCKHQKLHPAVNFTERMRRIVLWRVSGKFYTPRKRISKPLG